MEPQQYQRALVCFDRALAIAPGEAEWWYWKRRTLRNLHRDEDALAADDRALEITPQYTDAARERAAALFRLKRYNEALVAYDVALTLTPLDDPDDLNFWKGVTLCRIERHEDALACFARALEVAPDNTRAARERADALFCLHRDDEAIDAYDAALGLAAPDDQAELNYWKARTLHRLRRYEEALKSYNQALALNEAVADWWRQTAVVCLALRQYGDGLLAAEYAVTLEETNADGWKLKGCALFDLGRYLEALAAHEQAVQLAPHNSQIWEYNGACLYQLNRFEEAAAAYDEAVRLNPDDAGLRGRYAATMPYIRRTTTDHRLKLRDGRWLGYLDYGDLSGTPIICCHGTPSSRLEFFCDKATLNELHIRLIVPDRPGYGLSDFQRHRRLLDWPSAVEQLANHLNVERFAVLGVSGGGPHAAACAFAIPHRLTHVGIVSSEAPLEILPRIRKLPPGNRPSLILARYSPWLLMLAIYSPFAWLAQRFPRMQLAIESSRSALSKEDARAARDAIWNNPKKLSPAEQEAITEPYRKGARGHAWGMRGTSESVTETGDSRPPQYKT